MRAVGVGVVTLLVLRAVGASAAPPAKPADLPIFFDTREDIEQPIVSVRMFGRTLKMLLDTGSARTILGPKAAGIPLDVVQAGHIQGTDCNGRPIVGVWAPLDLRLPKGWPTLGNQFLVSDWIDRMNQDLFIDPGAPHFDGVISPMTLAAKDRVVVMDFTERSLSVGTWDDAQRRLAAADRALTSSFGSITSARELIVPAVVQGRRTWFLLDTGFGRSMLYVPRDLELLPMLSRHSRLTATVEVGEVTSKLSLALFEKIEPLWPEGAPAPFEGILGMDVLRACIMAFDDSRFLVRCRSREPPPTSFDLGSMRSPRPVRSLPIVEAGSEGVPMRQHPDGSYDWRGRHVAAVIHKDGRVTYSNPPARPGTPLDRMDAEEERRWFEEQTAGFLAALAHANEWRTIRDALDTLPRYLAQILDDRRLSLAQRRRVLFLLWDEMAEAEDRERGWAGTEARAIIDAFIRKRLPDGGPNGYSPDELAAFNRTRRDGIRFDPYRPVDEKADRTRLRDRLDEP